MNLSLRLILVLKVFCMLILKKSLEYKGDLQMSIHLYKLNNYKDKDNNTIYTFTNAFPFSNQDKLKPEYRKESFDFAYAMSFTEEGHHRRTRSGGTAHRYNVQVFCDTFIGKLGEFAVYQFFQENGVELKYPDLSIMGEGKWDSYDFEYNKLKIGVKTTKQKGHLFLLETKDWNNKGDYIPNIPSDNSRYDDFLFVRINSNIVSNLKRIRNYFKNIIDIEILNNEFEKASYEFDISHISKDLLVMAIQNRNIIPKGAFLQSLKTEMDAENYYIQSGDMFTINSYINKLK
jgi:hypothetical protein